MDKASRSSRFASQVVINLAANVAQGLLGVALIPLATRILGPEDYGVYGMAIVVVALIVSLCETGAAYVLYGSFSSVQEDERSELFSSLLVLSAATGAVAAFLLWVLWSQLAHFEIILATLTPLEKSLACLAVPFRTIWSIANPILIAQIRSNWVAACISLQAVAAFVVVLVSLYVFGQERASLFWGNFAGAAACLTLALYAIGRSAWAVPRLRWMRQVARIAPGAWLAGVTVNLYATIESDAVARAVGSAGLGNYSHARIYQGLLMQGTNAFANVLWPLALQDAVDRSSQFMRVRLAWNFVYLCLTLMGLVFVFFGENIVSMLTNGKFDQAAAWIPFFVIYLLIQNSGKPATSVLYAANRGNTISAIRIASTSAAVVAILFLVPQFGVLAAIAIAIAEMILMRVLIQVSAHQIRTVPFQDQWVLFGCVVIGAAWLLVHFVTSTEGERLGLFALACAFLLVLANRSFVKYSKVNAHSYLRGLLSKKETHV